jgi:hypothetical protein
VNKAQIKVAEDTAALIALMSGDPGLSSTDSAYLPSVPTRDYGDGA